MAAVKLFLQDSLGEHVVASLPAPYVSAPPPAANRVCAGGRNATIIEVWLKPNYYPSEVRNLNH